VAKLIKFPLLGMSDSMWTIILVVIYLSIAFLPMLFNYQYISYSDEEENIVIRYFTTGILSGNKNSIEISKSTFKSYQIETSFFGLNQKLILYQKFREGFAKYPPVYISSLTRREKEKLVMSLNSYISR